APLTYQWFTNGLAAGGATNSTLTLPFVTTNSLTNCIVIVSNANGSVISSNASLTVVLPPVITEQPQALKVVQGQSAQFSIMATGPGLGYQWRLNGVALTNGSGFSGAT